MEEVSSEFMDELLDELRKDKIKYTFSISGSTMTLKSRLGNYFNTRTGIKIEELPFISKVSQHVKGKKFSFKRLKKDNIVYHSYSKLRDGKLEDVYEVDINNAYWMAAYKLGVIDKKLYDEGLKVDKITRLASLGSLAKNPTVILFDGRKEKFIRDKPSSTSYIWFTICNEIAEVMSEVRDFIDKDFIFYWVDGVFIKKRDNIKLVQKILEYHGYESKVRNLTKIVVSNKEGKVIIHEKGQKPRPFPLIK